MNALKAKMAATFLTSESRKLNNMISDNETKPPIIMTQLDVVKMSIKELEEALTTK